MGTHIIWRNPSPPRKREFKLSRVAGNGTATTYQVAIPSGYRHPFELVRTTVGWAGRRAANQQVEVSPGAQLVSARW
jgi:hypothetical protein